MDEMSSERSIGRNVHVFDSNHPETAIGGLVVTNGVTNLNFYYMLSIICLFEKDYYIRTADDTIIPKNHDPFQPGKYYIVSEGFITINDELWLTRTTSTSTGSRNASFRTSVLERDQRCVLTGIPVIDMDSTGFQAAHIFPLAHLHHWSTNNYDRWITIQPKTGGPINSVQNGMLLLAHMRIRFDSYLLSINPDDNYKIVCFKQDAFGVAGKHLDRRFIDDPRRPVDQLLRWHFRQAVLANMRGAGEPIFQCDFPPGSDKMGAIMSSPWAAQWMEFELFDRLATYTTQETIDA